MISCDFVLLLFDDVFKIIKTDVSDSRDDDDEERG